MNPLKKIRMLSGFSQALVAEKLAITQASYARIELGQTKLTADRIVELAKIFDVSKGYFLTGENTSSLAQMEEGITYEYIKKLININTELRQKLDEQTSKRIEQLQMQNQQLMQMLAEKLNTT